MRINQWTWGGGASGSIKLKGGKHLSILLGEAILLVGKGGMLYYVGYGYDLTTAIVPNSPNYAYTNTVLLNKRYQVQHTLTAEEFDEVVTAFEEAVRDGVLPNDGTTYVQDGIEIGKRVIEDARAHHYH